jgi:hypothetical protein
MNINLRNLALLLRLLGAIATTVSTWALLNADKIASANKIALACSLTVMVSAELINFLKNPDTFPQTPIVQGPVDPNVPKGA